MREAYGFLDAVLRLDRAHQHLEAIDAIIAGFRTERRDVGLAIEPATLEELLAQPMGQDLRQVAVPHSLSIRIGEFAYNVRASLDYLVSALAWHDTGREPSGAWARGLQFPLEEQFSKFDRKARRMLHGLSDEHVDLVREYQPASGCRWAWRVDELSNADKHRHLLVLIGSYDTTSGRWETRTTPTEDAEPDDEQGRHHAGDMSLETLANLDVALPDGELVMDALNTIATGSTALLRRFAAEFVLRPV